MQNIDEARLENDLSYRFEYVAQFIGFGEEDVATIHGSAGVIAPLVPQLVDAVYDKLFSFDATKRHFVPRQHGYDGDLPEDVEKLTQDHDMIQFRKQHLARYLERLVTRPYNAEMVKYLDFVGAMHTPSAGNAELDVPLVQMNALMGFVSNALTSTILSLDLDCEAKKKAVCAFNKLLWIQNDLITKHYAHEVSTAVA